MSNNFVTVFILIIVLQSAISLILSRSDLNALIPRINHVKSIKITHSNLTSVQSNCFKDLYFLENLDLSNLGIVNLPNDIFDDLYSLESLKIKMNHLKSTIMINGQYLKNLKVLDLSYNKLENIEQVFEGLETLEKLILFGNKLKTLKNNIFCHLNELKRLDLGSNQLRELHPLLFEHLRNLQILSLTANNLITFPDISKSNTNLEHLDLSHNAFTTIPKEISLLKNLKSLNLAHNRIAIVDTNGFIDSPLTTLNLESNLIYSIQLLHLNNLNFINLNSNRIKSLKGVFEHDVRELTVLKIGNNFLIEIPDDFLNRFTNLKSFDASGNNICHIKAQVISPEMCYTEFLVEGTPASLYMLTFRDSQGCIRLKID